RNQALDDLSKIINIEVSEDKDGTINIYSEGAFLLDSVNQYFLKTDYESTTSKLLKPVWTNGGDFFLHTSLTYSSATNTDIGSLRGLMVARGTYLAKYSDVPVKPQVDDPAYLNEDGSFNQDAYDRALDQYGKDLEVYNDTIEPSVVMTVQSQLDTLVHGIVTAINDLLCPNKEVTLEDGSTAMILDVDNCLMGDDGNNTIGAELFSRRGIDRYTKTTLSILNEDGTYSEQEVYLYNEEDLENEYSLYSIDQLVINPVVLQDSSTLPTKYTETSGNYGGYANVELQAIAQSFNQELGTLEPNSLTSYSALDYYVGMCSNLANVGSVWNGIVTNQQATVNSLDVERQDVMGVSTDEELSDLIKFQRCYDASARYITTISEMLEHVIEKLGG
ncbi:MAG: hypothetical protein K6G62_03020, partial [Eubacterium sp.]|nr:hypothetical protein [Eubacterium sp.]